MGRIICGRRLASGGRGQQVRKRGKVARCEIHLYPGGIHLHAAIVFISRSASDGELSPDDVAVVRRNEILIPRPVRAPARRLAGPSVTVATCCHFVAFTELCYTKVFLQGSMLNVTRARLTDDIEAFDSSHCCLGFFFPKRGQGTSDPMGRGRPNGSRGIDSD